MNNASSKPESPDIWIQTEVLQPQMATTLLYRLRKEKDSDQSYYIASSGNIPTKSSEGHDISDISP